MKRTGNLTRGLLLLAGLSVAGSAAAQGPVGIAAGEWSRKVEPSVLEEASAEPAEFLVFLAEQADLSGAAALPCKREKGEFAYRALARTAERTQGPLLQQLRSLGAEVHPFWVANMILVKGDLAAVRAMAERPEVRRVLANPQVPLRPTPGETRTEEGAAPSAVPWNVSKVQAPGAWALGYKGQGVVVGINDTGTDWTHPALKPHYRGWNGSAADHNFNWYDAVHTDTGKCGADVPYPCDAYGHGTPVTGTVDGDDGAGNQVGVAPEAQWIACRCMDTAGYGSPARYSECLQWFVAPTDLAGRNPDPSRAPDITNNSWGCVAEEGCTDPLVLKTAVESVKAAGIAVVAAAGNEGPGCSSTGDPPSNYAATFVVGGSDENDLITSSSSRGPALAEGTPVIKPDVVAPGTNVRSCKEGGGYLAGGGTSAASPHVAGVMALLISANPNLAGRVAEMEVILRETAAPKTTTESCGGVPGSQRPNNTFGWGRVDALAAVSASCTVECQAAAPEEGAPGVSLSFQASASRAGVCATGNIAFEWDFGDGTAPSHQQNPSRAYASPGSYTWSLTASLGETRCSRTGSVRIADPVVPPVVTSVKKLGNPFRLQIGGSGFQPGITVTIGSDPAPWPGVTISGPTSLTLGSGKTLKAKFPKGRVVPIRLVNPDGGEATAAYTRP